MLNTTKKCKGLLEIKDTPHCTPLTTLNTTKKVSYNSGVARK